MSILSALGRIPKIMEANLNDLIDKAEDPVKMMNQLIVDAKKDLAETKRSLTAVMADAESAHDAVDKTKADIDRYMNSARNAAKQGQEADAKELLRKKQQLEGKLPSLEENAKSLDDSVADIREAYDDLRNKIEDLEQRRDITIGKAHAAAGQERVNKTVSSSKGSKALEAFDRYEEKTNKRLSQAKAAAKLDSEGDSAEALADKYSSGANGSVDDEYAKLMAELNG